ncbi:MAG TPA: hypothetical protein VHB98_00205 [Chloroflexota bacterium]|nr:hypothetical protein [Chloroflexota bacterium]
MTHDGSSATTRLVWTRQQSDLHTVTSTQGVWTSGALDTSAQFTRVFRKTGTFPQCCESHPFMQGTIIVQKEYTREMRYMEGSRCDPTG